LLEKIQQLAPLQLAANDGRSGLVNTMDMENGFGGVDTDHANIHADGPSI